MLAHRPCELSRGVKGEVHRTTLTLFYTSNWRYIWPNMMTVVKPRRLRRWAEKWETGLMFSYEAKQMANKSNKSFHEANFLSKTKRMTNMMWWLSQDKRSILAVCEKLMCLKNLSTRDLAWCFVLTTLAKYRSSYRLSTDLSQEPQTKKC